MNSLVSWYSSLICPLSPLVRTAIIAGVVILAILHIRLMQIAEGWLRRPDLGLSRRFARAALVGAHIDATIVGGFALLHSAAEAACPAPVAYPWVRLSLPMAASGAMVLFAWLLFASHVRSRMAGE